MTNATHGRLLEAWGRAWISLAVVLIVFGVFAAASNSATASQSVNHEPDSLPTPPPLPAFIRSAYGPVRVILRPNLHYDGDSLYGMWHPHIRTIFVRDSMPLWFQHAVLEHEICHVALTDFSVSIPYEVEERVCDAIAHQRSIEAIMR